MKLCNKCDTRKCLEEFGVHPTTKDKRRTVCRACVKLQDRQRNSPNDYPSLHYRTAKNIRSKFGISLDTMRSWIKEQVKLQAGACAICGSMFSEENKMNLDHDHTTGELRGYLCNPCNLSLQTHVTVDWLTKAITYLQKNKATLSE